MSRRLALCGLAVAMLALQSACATRSTDRAIGVVGPGPARAWTEDFGDPTLQGLLAAADSGSLDVRIAVARLRRAGADVELARAGQAPQVAIGVAAAAGGARFDTAKAAISPTLEASYEIDLWGRLDKAAQAAEAGQRSAAADVLAARLLVGSETTRTYLALRGAQTAMLAARARGDMAERALALAKVRLANGRGVVSDLDARQQAVEDAAAETVADEAEAERQLIKLGALTGQTTPIAAPAAAPLLNVAPTTAPTVASDTVTSRPDVQAAFARLAQADAARAEAVAAARPRFVISAGAGSADVAVLSLLDARSLAWAVAASLTHSLFDGGANKARIHAAEAEAEIADLGYRRAVVQGWAELRQAVTSLGAAQAGCTHAQAALARARQALVVGGQRHDAGVIDGLDLIALQAEAARAAEAATTAQLEALKARIDLALAAGGAAPGAS